MTDVRTLAAVGAALTLTLAACGGSGGEKPAEQGKNTDSRGDITFAMGKNDTDKIKPIIEAWNKVHPKEKVTLHELAGEADAQRDTLVQSLQTKSGEYDIMAVDVTDTAYFAANSWLQPIEGDTSVDTSKLLKAAVESATYNGKVYAVPMNTNAQLLFYRTDLMPNPPKTWDELKSSCERAKAAKVDCLDTQLKQYEGLTVNVSEFINGWGGTVVGEDGKTPTLDKAETKEGFTALVDGYQDGTIAKRTTGFTEEQTHLVFLRGETMYAINWPYMYDKAKTEGSSKVKDKFNVAPIVGKSGPGASTLGGYNNGINVYSEHKATAKDFLEFMINEDNQMSFAKASFPPVLSSIYDDAALQKEFPYLPSLKEALDNAKPRPVTPFYPAVSKAIQDNAYAALNGQKSVDDALKDMTEAIQQAAK